MTKRSHEAFSVATTSSDKLPQRSSRKSTSDWPKVSAICCLIDSRMIESPLFDRLSACQAQKVTENFRRIIHLHRSAHRCANLFNSFDAVDATGALKIGRA